MVQLDGRQPTKLLYAGSSPAEETTLFSPIYSLLQEITMNNVNAHADDAARIHSMITHSEMTNEVLEHRDIPSAPIFSIQGGILYVENGTLKYRGSSGTTTTIAVA